VKFLVYSGDFVEVLIVQMFMSSFSIEPPILDKVIMVKNESRCLDYLIVVLNVLSFETGDISQFRILDFARTVFLINILFRKKHYKKQKIFKTTFGNIFRQAGTHAEYFYYLLNLYYQAILYSNLDYNILTIGGALLNS